MPIAVGVTVVVLAVSAYAQKPSADEVRGDVGKGDYRGALSKLDKLLFYSSAQMPADQRYELLMLKGECRIQLQDRLGAASAFKSAAKEAGDVKQLAAAQANMLVLERATSGRYTPRYGDSREPIDVLPPDSRKRAMAALQSDLVSQYKTQLEGALRADRLAPVEQVFTPAAQMYLLEVFISGETGGPSAATMRELGGHAFELMQAEVSRLARRVDQIGQIANSSGTSARGFDSGPIGLTSMQRNELKSMMPYLVKIRDRATEYRRVAGRLGGNEGKWEALLADTSDAILDADALTNDR